MNNAIKFTNEGGIIELIIELVEDEIDRFFMIMVKDNGVGISFLK